MRCSLRVPPDRRSIRTLREAAAQHAGQRLLDLGVGGFRVLIEEGLRRQDDAVEAEAALRRLLVDERLLNRMRLVEACRALRAW